MNVNYQIKKNFLISINNKDISDEDYEHAKNVFEKFNF